VCCTPTADCDGQCSGTVDTGCGIIDCSTSCTGGDVCFNDLCCTPVTDCAGQCTGTMDDGCGGTFDCSASCTGGDVCFNDVCCTPTADCDGQCSGTVDTGCGIIDCSTSCTGGDVCFNDVCCTPATCDGQCLGTINDGCGNQIICDDQCPPGEICNLGECCDPTITCESGPFCGTVDACGIPFECPGCIEGFECVDNMCCNAQCDSRRCGTFNLCGEDVDCDCPEGKTCFNTYCVDAECTLDTHCQANEICDNNSCRCGPDFVRNDAGNCVTDPCIECTGSNTVCDTGVACYCKPGYAYTNNACIQTTSPDGDQTTDLHFTQSLPVDADDVTVPLDFIENIDGSLRLQDPEQRVHMLQWSATSGAPIAGNYVLRVTVNAAQGSFGIFAGVGQQTDANDGYGVMFSNIGNGPQAAMCLFHFGDKLCSAPQSYPFPLNQDVDLEVTVVRSGGVLKFAARISGQPILRTEFLSAQFPNNGVIGFYFEPSTTTSTEIKETSLVYGNSVVLDLYSCLSDAQFADIYFELTGSSQTPTRTVGNNGKCNLAQ